MLMPCHMKMTSKISALLLAVSLTACLQAQATSLSYTNAINYVSERDPHGALVEAPSSKTGQFVESSMKGNSHTTFQNNFSSSSYSISSVDVYVDMYDAIGHATTLTLTGSGLSGSLSGVSQVPNSSPDLLEFVFSSTSNSALFTYLVGALKNDLSIDYEVQADCYLENISMVVNTAPNTGGNNSSVPDMATTVILLGSSLLGLEVLRRKFVPAKA